MKPGSRRCTSRTHPFSSQCSSGTLSQELGQVRWNCNLRFASFLLSFLKISTPVFSSGSSPPSDLAWKNFLFWTLGNPTQVRWFNSVWYKWKETFLIWWWREAVAYKKKTGSSNYWKDLAEVRYIGNMAFRLRKGRFESAVLFSFFIGIFSNLDFPILIYKLQIPSFMLLLALEWSTGTPMPSFLSPGAGWTSFFEATKIWEKEFCPTNSSKRKESKTMFMTNIRNFHH